MENQTFLFQSWYSRESNFSLRSPQRSVKVSKPKRWATRDRSLQELEVIQVLRQVPGCPYKFCAYGGKRHGLVDMNCRSLTVYSNSGRPAEDGQKAPTIACSFPADQSYLLSTTKTSS